LRTAAIASLCWEAALKPSEATALDVADLVTLVQSPAVWTVRAWTTIAGIETVIPYRTRRAVAAYLDRALTSRWIRELAGPLFRSRPNKRITVRAAQISWHAMQARADADRLYSFAELRADRLKRARRQDGAPAVAYVGRIATSTAARIVAELDYEDPRR
jgi:hypothetical protein